MRAAKQLLFFYLTVILIIAGSYIMDYFFQVTFLYIFVPAMFAFYLAKRFLYPFRRCEQKQEECHYFWKIYAYFCVINLFALTVYTIIDVAIDNELTSFFRYWFFVWIGSFVPLAVYGVYLDIQRVRHGGDKKEGEITQNSGMNHAS